jgi:hypothetical protein
MKKKTKEKWTWEAAVRRCKPDDTPPKHIIYNSIYEPSDERLMLTNDADKLLGILGRNNVI